MSLTKISKKESLELGKQSLELKEALKNTSIGRELKKVTEDLSKYVFILSWGEPHDGDWAYIQNDSDPNKLNRFGRFLSVTDIGVKLELRKNMKENMVWDMTWEEIFEKVTHDLAQNCFCKTCNQGHNDYTKSHNNLIFSQKFIDTPTKKGKKK